MSTVEGEPSKARARALDAEELVTNVLPKCQTQPSLYNLIAKLTYSIQHEADALARSDADSNGTPYERQQFRSFVLHIPGNSQSDVDERRKDIELLNHLQQNQSRPFIVQKLQKLQIALEDTIYLDERKTKEESLRHSKELPILLKTMISFLPRLEDRPYVYNKVVEHIKMAVVQIDSSCHTLLRLKQAVKPFVIPQEIQQDDEESSHDRWEDVGRLDEILDYLNENTFVYSIFQAMKNNCEMDARILQQLETGQGDKNRLNETTLGHLEEVRLL